jgi:hypothetical protein
MYSVCIYIYIYIYIVYLYWAYAQTVLEMSRPAREPARWALRHAPYDLDLRPTPILDKLDPKPITTVQSI